VAKQGLPDRFPGDPTPLCQGCWRREERSRAKAAQREQLARAWDDAAALEEAIAAETCAACGSPEPTPQCWLCAWSWLQQPAQQLDVDRAVAAAAVEAEFARIAARAVAQAWVDEVVTWLGRLHMVLTAYTSPRPADRGRGRAVELLADFMARQKGARTAARGRPSHAAYVAAVLAVDADYRSGRRALPGLENTVAFAGVKRRTVSAAWKEAQELRWARRTNPGGRCSLAKRAETGRWNDRAEWDLIPLHRSDPAARAPYIPAALAILTELETHGQAVLAAAYDDLEATLQTTGTCTDMPEMVMRAQARTAAAKLRAAVAAWLLPSLNSCHPHTVTTGMSIYSCLYLGKDLDPTISITAVTGSHSIRWPRSGRGRAKNQDGASRSSTREAVFDLGLTDGAVPDPQPRTRAPWWDWAPQLTNDLLDLWPWLRNAAWKAVAATLGSRTGPDWTAQALTAFVTERNGRPILMTPAAPLAYLIRLLERAFYGMGVPPCPARLRTEYVRKATAADQARQAAARTAQAAVASTAAHARSGPGRDELASARQAAAVARADREAGAAADRAAAQAEWTRAQEERTAELAVAGQDQQVVGDAQWRPAVPAGPITTEEILDWILGPASSAGGTW
jgi:hypothetical protein